MDSPLDAHLETIAAGLADPGWVKVGDFLDPPAVAAIASLLRQHHESGGLRPAGVGRGRTLRVRPEIRSDQVLWVDNDAPPAPLGAFIDRMGRLRTYLNRSLMLGLQDYECHLTVYPRGSFYRRHLDRFAEASRRQVSTVLYLNPDWRRQDGGELRLELAGGGRADILPDAGTLVAFRSADFWHEVRRARRRRLSVTGWLLTAGS